MDNLEDKKSKKQHTCTQCGKFFNRLAHLYEHIKRVHEGIPYQCSLYHKHFSTESYRNQHQRQCQTTSFICKDCGQEFRKVLEMQSHRMNAHQQPGPSGAKRKQPRQSTEKDTSSTPK